MDNKRRSRDTEQTELYVYVRTQTNDGVSEAQTNTFSETLI